MTTAIKDINLIGSPRKVIVADLLNRLPGEATLAEIAEEVRILAELKDAFAESCDENLPASGKSQQFETLEALVRLPRDSTFEEMIDEIKLLIGLREAEEDIREGRVIPHDEVKRIAATWSTFNALLCPKKSTKLRTVQ